MIKDCTVCKWEHVDFAEECNMCSRISTDNYERRQEEKPKKKLTFSERQKIVNQYHEWCLINNALDCADSFLAYLIIKGYIDG